LGLIGRLDWVDVDIPIVDKNIEVGSEGGDFKQFNINSLKNIYRLLVIKILD